MIKKRTHAGSAGHMAAYTRKPYSPTLLAGSCVELTVRPCLIRARVFRQTDACIYIFIVCACVRACVYAQVSGRPAYGPRRACKTSI